MQFVDVLLGVLTLGQGTAAMKPADLTGKDAAKQLLKVWAVDAVSDTAAYTAGYVCDELGMPPGVTFIASLLTGCTVSLEVGKYVFRDGGKIVKQLDADEMLEYVGGGGKGGTDALETVSKTNPFDLQPTHSQTLSKNKMNALMDDIKINGIQEPIKYVEYNGQMYVVDGHHRLLAAKKLGLTEITVKKVDLPYAGYNTIDDLLWFE